MPVVLPSDLPAVSDLRAEGVQVLLSRLTESEAASPGPVKNGAALKIGVLNLMPRKTTTELQLSRMLGSGPPTVELTLLRMSDHKSKTTPMAYLEEFYVRFADARHMYFDGLIVTGAPIEHLPFEDVWYWKELTEVFDWSQTHVGSTLGLCWGAQALLYHFSKVDKRILDHKLFGLYDQAILCADSPYLADFDGKSFTAPVSRWTDVRASDIEACGDGLEILAASDESGVCLVADRARNVLYMFNHLEYDSDTLKLEYDRDISTGASIEKPRNYNIDAPQATWRPDGIKLYQNWLAEIIKLRDTSLQQ